jgi:hypothetical protein
LPAFHHGSHLRELFHPKGSASGQASWDVVCTGVTRLRLSQSRDAPPTPVIMPGDMMPKPPGSGLQIRPRAPPSLPCRGVPPRHVLHRSEDCGVTVIDTYVNKKVTRYPASPAGGAKAASGRRLSLRTPMRSIGYARFSAAGGDVQRRRRPTRPPEPAIGPATSGRTRWAFGPPHCG